MISDDHDAVVIPEIVERSTLHLKIIFPAFAHDRKVGIVVTDLCTLFLQKLNDGKRRGFAEIVYIFLVGNAENKNPGTIQRLLVLVEGSRDGVQDMIGHAGVDLTGQLNKACSEIPFLCFPRKIKRIYRNAMTAEAWPRIEGLEAKWLGRSRVYHFPNINSHAQTKEFQLIYQCDVDATV